MLKYSLRTIHGRLPRKGFIWFLWWINLQLLILVKLFYKKIFFFAKNHCEIQVRTILICAFYSIEYSRSKKTFHRKKTPSKTGQISVKMLQFSSVGQFSDLVIDLFINLRQRSWSKLNSTRWDHWYCLTKGLD